MSNETMASAANSMVRITEPTGKFNAKVEDIVYRKLCEGRRYFGSSGASLTHQVYNPQEGSQIDQKSAKIGLDGERETTRFLREWAADKPNVVLIDSVSIRKREDGKPDARLRVMTPEEIAEQDKSDQVADEESGIVDSKDTDHILVIGHEIILVDTKTWRKGFYSVMAGGEVVRTKQRKKFPGGKVRMRGAVWLWYKYLEDYKNILGMVLINHDEATVQINDHWYKSGPWRLVSKSEAEKFLNLKWDKIKDEQKGFIDTTLVSKIVACCVPPYDRMKQVIHASGFNELSL